MQKINKYDLKLSVMPNGLEKCMTFTVSRNLVFIDSMQAMNCSINKMIKNLMDNDFKYLSEECGNLLKLVKQKRVYPYEYMDSLKGF